MIKPMKRCEAAMSSSASLIIFLLLPLLELWRPSYCQMGLRAQPLTSDFRNNSSNLDWLSKAHRAGNGRGLSLHNMNVVPSIEHELAEIFRGVAYGMTTDSTSTITTTTITTTTTPQPTTERFKHYFNSNHHSTFPEADSFPRNDGARPVQHQFVESPILVKDTNMVEEEEVKEDYEFSTESISPTVIRADIVVSDIPWVASLGSCWHIHVYTTAGLFSLIAASSLVCLARLYLTCQLLPRGYYITVHLLVFLAAFFRCVIFFHDPYAIENRLPSGLSNILFNTGTPCIITALAVLVLGILHSTRLNILPLNLQSPIAVAIISAALIAGSITADILGDVIEEPELTSGLKAAIQALTAGWGAALCLGYIVIFRRIFNAAKRQYNEIVRLTFSRFHTDGASLPKRFRRFSLSYCAVVTLIASIFGLIVDIILVYGLMNPDGITTLPPSQPWNWFVYQTSWRVCEVIMWSCICIASSLPTNISKITIQTSFENGQLLTVFSSKKCAISCINLRSCCMPDRKSSDDIYSTMCHSNHVPVRNFSVQNDNKPIPRETMASFDFSPQQINTSLLPQKSLKCNRKSDTLHSGNSEAQLLWNSNGTANTLYTCSRPSSLILTEGGLIKFRTHDPHSDSVKISNFLKSDYDNISELLGTEKVLQNCNKTDLNNYVNNRVLSPEEKTFLDKARRMEGIQNLKEKSRCGIYRTNSFNNEGNITRISSLGRESKRKVDTSFSMKHQNNDTHVNEDGDDCCHNSSLSSYVDSNGHLYASIQQETDGWPCLHQCPHLHSKELYHSKSINNSSARTQTPVHSQTKTEAVSQLNVMQTGYLTDASQDYVSPQTDMSVSLSDFFQYHYKRNGDNSSNSSKFSPCQSSGLSPPRCSPYPTPKKKLNCNGKDNIVLNDYVVYKEDKCAYSNDETSSLEGCPTSPSGRRLFNKIAPTYVSVSYSPLQSDDQNFEEKESVLPPQSPVRKNVSRPRRPKRSSPKSASNVLPNALAQDSCMTEIEVADETSKMDNLFLVRDEHKHRRLNPEESTFCSPPSYDKVHSDEQICEDSQIDRLSFPSFKMVAHPDRLLNDVDNDDVLERNIRIEWLAQCKDEAV